MQLCKLSSSSVSPFCHKPQKKRKERKKNCRRLSHNFPKHLILVQSIFRFFFCCSTRKQQKGKKISASSLKKKNERKILQAEDEKSERTKKKSSSSVGKRQSSSQEFESVTMLTPNKRLMFHDFYYSRHRNGNRVATTNDTFWREKFFLSSFFDQWLSYLAACWVIKFCIVRMVVRKLKALP